MRAAATWSEPREAEAGLDRDDEQVDQLRELAVDRLQAGARAAPDEEQRQHPADRARSGDDRDPQHRGESIASRASRRRPSTAAQSTR